MLLPKRKEEKEGKEGIRKEEKVKGYREENPRSRF